MNVANQFTTNADGTVTLYLYQNKTEFGALPIEVRLSKKNIPILTAVLGYLGTITLSTDHLHTVLSALSLAIRHSKDDRANPYRDMQVYLCELAGIKDNWIATGQFPPCVAALEAKKS